jgi:hypothetical protein
MIKTGTSDWDFSHNDQNLYGSQTMVTMLKTGTSDLDLTCYDQNLYSSDTVYSRL